MPIYRNKMTGFTVEVLEGTRMCKAYELVKEEAAQVKPEIPKPQKPAKKSPKKKPLEKKLKKTGVKKEKTKATKKASATSSKTEQVTSAGESEE